MIPGHYTHVFLESVQTACVLPGIYNALLYVASLITQAPSIAYFYLQTTDPTFFAMHDFGGYNMPAACFLAITGATLGQMANWMIGLWLLRQKNDNRFKVNEYWYNRVLTLFNQYGIFLLLFSWAPLCNLFVVLAGMLGARFKLVFTLVLAGQLFHYGQYF